MVDERLAEFGQRAIPCEFLFRIPAGYRIEEIEDYEYKPLRQLSEVFGREGGKQDSLLGDGVDSGCGSSLEYGIIFAKGYRNTRVVCGTDRIREDLDKFAEDVFPESMYATSDKAETILVLGTEEFMFPAMLIGHRLEQNDPQLEVKFHATTRSPIEISDGEGYPLQTRHPLLSLYDETRQTFIYNLKKYDHVIIVTDAYPVVQKGLDSLLAALKEVGNEDIRLISREA